MHRITLKGTRYKVKGTDIVQVLPTMPKSHSVSLYTVVYFKIIEVFWFLHMGENKVLKKENKFLKFEKPQT